MRKNVVKIKLARHSHPALLTCCLLLLSASCWPFSTPNRRKIPYHPQYSGHNLVLSTLFIKDIYTISLWYITVEFCHQINRWSLKNQGIGDDITQLVEVIRKKWIKNTYTLPTFFMSPSVCLSKLCCRRTPPPPSRFYVINKSF